MIVLDVCAAYAVVDGSPEGRALRGLLLDGEQVIAPELFCLEAANAAWKSVRFGGLEERDARRRFELALSIVDEFFSDTFLAAEAFGEAVRYRHPAYDLAYAVLARRTGSTLFTLDGRLSALCREMHVDCIEEARL